MVGVYESDSCEHGYKWTEECPECNYLDYLVWGTLNELEAEFDTREEERGER